MPLYLAIGALFAALGLWVLLAAPKRNLNRALAAVLLLWAGSNVVFQLMRDATTAEAHAAYRAAASLYEVPTAFLFLFIADELFLPKPRTRPRKAALAGLALFTLVMGAALGSYPWAQDSIPSPRPGDAFPVAYTLGFLPVVDAAAIFATEALVVVIAARSAAAAPAGSVERQRAALVALAFGILVAHNAGTGLGAPLTASTSRNFLLGQGGLLAAVEAASALAVAYAAPRIAAAWRGRARAAAVLLLAIPLATGFFDLARDTLAPGFSVPFYVNTRFLWVTAFGLGLAVAILRFDLASAGTERSRRRAAVTSALLALGVAGIAAGYAVSALGPSPLGLGLGLVALASPAALALPPLRAVPRRLAELMTLPKDPALDRERARIYVAALREAAARTGAEPPAADAALRELRERLGLAERDHGLLLSAVEESRPSLEPGALLLGRYRIVRELGRGGFGEAWLARDGREGRDVVLKRLAGERRRDAEALRRFRKEARLAGLLDHPHIVRVLGVEEAGGEPMLVTEYCPGGSLADRLRGGALPEAEVRRIGAEVLDALGALHGAGIVHRDVKPSNILFDGQGRAKLGDFTLAREVVSGETRGGAPGLQGTFPYLAPEQARGLPAGPQADLYALGATLYEAATGAPVFDTDGLPAHEAALRVTKERPRLPAPQLSAELNAALAEALAKDPGARFPDATAMAVALEGTTAGHARRRGRQRAPAG